MADQTSADAGLDMVTEAAAELHAAASQIEAQVGEEGDEQTQDTMVVEAGDTATKTADTDPAKLQAALTARDAELAESNKRYAELQSLESRHFNEQREREAQLRERLAAIEARANREPEPDPTVVMEQQRKFDDEWAERLTPGDPEKGRVTLELFRGMMGEYLEETKRMVNSKLVGLDGKVRTLNPVYQENKELIDSLVAKGISENDALITAGVVSGNKKSGPKTVKQPGAPVAPGAVGTPTRSATGTKTVRPLGLAYSPMNQEVMRMAGITSKEEIDAIARDAGRMNAND